MRLLKKIFGSTLLLLNTIAIILLILSAFSDRVSPNIAIVFPFLGLLFPFILCINLFFCFWWLLMQKWKYVFFCLVSLLLCSGAIWTYFPIHKTNKDIPSDCIKLLTYNVMQFEHKKAHSKKNPNLVIQYIIDNDADIVCIQEYGTTKKANLLSEKDIDSALKKYPYKKVHAIDGFFDGDIFGLAVFSKYPILSTTAIDFGSEYNGAILLELDINGKRVSIINNHLESNKLSMEERYEYRDLLGDFGSKKLEEISGKMAKRLSPAFKARARQAEIIADLIKNNQNPYIIVCGDFNDTPISYARHTVKKNLDDAFVNSGSGIGITYNKYRFYFRIDYIMHSKNIKAYNCTVGKIKNSDHYPVWTYLELK